MTHQQGLQLLQGHSQSQRLLLCVRPLASKAARDRDESPGLQEASLSFSHTATCLLSFGASGPVRGTREMPRDTQLSGSSRSAERRNLTVPQIIRHVSGVHLLHSLGLYFVRSEGFFGLGLFHSVPTWLRTAEASGRWAMSGDVFACHDQAAALPGTSG